MMRKKRFILSRFSDTRRGRGNAEFIYYIRLQCACKEIGTFIFFLPPSSYRTFLPSYILLAPFHCAHSTRSPLFLVKTSSSFLSAIRNYFYYLCATPENCIISSKRARPPSYIRCFNFDT